MEFRLLGSVEIAAQGQVFPITQPIQRVIIAVLACSANRTVPTAALVEAIWGEEPSRGRLRNLHYHISQVRRLFRDLEKDRPAARLLTRPSGYLLEVASGELDADDFVATTARAASAFDAGATDKAARLYRVALALWRGDALADATGADWQLTAEADRLEQMRLDALEALAGIGLDQGRYSEVAADLSSTVARQPTRERMCGQFMLALWRCGRRAEAIEVYVRVCQALRDALGLDPGPELVQLYQQILLDTTTELRPR
jgi:DNA-binding SARP family transcriptional activator